MIPRCALTILPLLATTAAACPLCDSERAEIVRQGIVDGDLSRTLLAILLPFALTFAAVAAIHFTGPGQRGELR